MKYEITKGSEKDFEGAPEWAMVRDKSNVAEYFSSGLDKGCKFIEVGDSSGEVYEFMGKYPNTKIIAERRPITEPVWDGEGLPPVGIECEFDWAGEGFNVGIVRYISKQTVIIECAQVENSYGIEDLTFRPIRSPEDVARHNTLYSLEALNIDSDVTVKIYDAIAAGKIKGVVLESKEADLKIDITTDEMWREFEKKSDMEDVYKLITKRMGKKLCGF